MIMINLNQARRYVDCKKKKENAEKCLKRELYEELSIRIKIIMKIFECNNPETNNYINYFYVKSLDDITVKNLTEGQNLGWFKKNQIKKLKMGHDLKIFFDFIN